MRGGGPWTRTSVEVIAERTGTSGSTRLGFRARRIDGIDMRQRSAAHSDRDRMLTGVARFKTGSGRRGDTGGLLMLVCSQAVMMLRMIVIVYCVDVQGRYPAGG